MERLSNASAEMERSGSCTVCLEQGLTSNWLGSLWATFFFKYFFSIMCYALCNQVEKWKRANGYFHYFILDTLSCAWFNVHRCEKFFPYKIKSCSLFVGKPEVFPCSLWIVHIWCGNSGRPCEAWLMKVYSTWTSSQAKRPCKVKQEFLVISSNFLNQFVLYRGYKWCPHLTSTIPVYSPSTLSRCSEKEFLQGAH